MPLTLQTGDTVQIPCRHCCKLIKSSAANHILKCPRCKAHTVVRIKEGEDGVLVYTEVFPA